jgi:hypothetical protein
MNDLAQDGVDVNGLLFLSNGRMLAAQDWFAGHEMADGEPAYKVYSGTDLLFVPEDEVDQIVSGADVREVLNHGSDPAGDSGSQPNGGEATSEGVET